MGTEIKSILGVPLLRIVFENDFQQPGRARQKDTRKTGAEQSEMGLSLEELIRRGARELIQKAIEVEVQELLAEYGNVKVVGGRRAVVRNGYLPERQVLTAIGPVAVRVPKVRDLPTCTRSGWRRHSLSSSRKRKSHGVAFAVWNASMSCSPAPSSGTASQHPPMTPNSSGSPLINPRRQHHVKKRGQRRRDGQNANRNRARFNSISIFFQGRFLMAASSAASAESGTASTPPARGKRSVPG